MNGRNTAISLRANLCGVFVILLGVVGSILSCSKSTDPEPNKPPDNGPVGILLSGSESDSALSGTSNHGPFAVPADEWDGDFVTTRLEAVINPSATVGTVNTALNGVGAKISCMSPGLMFTELVLPPQPSVVQAMVVCSTLVASGAFLSADPCVRPEKVNEANIFPSAPANGVMSHLEQARFPAAWNVRERVAALHSPVTVVVADHFRAFTTHPEIPQQTFIPGAGTVDPAIDSNGSATGNHGFWVAGTIGAKFDDVGSTGAYADPAGLLQLPCLSVAGLGSWYAVIKGIDDHLPSGRFILNTSIGYADDFSSLSKRRRIQHAFYWRRLVATKQDRFLHTQSSGNDGLASPTFANADYNSPFTLAARFDTPFQMLQGTSVPTADTGILRDMYNSVVATDPIYGVKLHNVVTVGSSDRNGNLSNFSNLPSDVRMIGEIITLPCIFDDAQCGPANGVALEDIVSGTSFAAPQVAALAAWLWSLSPALTVDETISIIKNCYNSKWVDAYKATLSLDHSISNAGIRLSLLDIADVNGQMGSNMKFDEKDLQMFLDSILYYEADRGAKTPPWPSDHSPFDLNGDGYSGDTMLTPSTAPFDLDVNTPPAYSQFQIHTCVDTNFNENAVTDRDILYYYAYSTLYTGNTRIRDSLLGCGQNVIVYDWGWTASANGGLDETQNPQMLQSHWPNDTTYSREVRSESPLCLETGYAEVKTTLNGIHQFTGQHKDLSSLDLSGATVLTIVLDSNSLCLDRLHAAGSVQFTLTFEVVSRPVNYTLDFSADMNMDLQTHSVAGFTVRLVGTTEEGQHFTVTEENHHGIPISISNGNSSGVLQPHCSYNLTLSMGLQGISDGHGAVTLSLNLN